VSQVTSNRRQKHENRKQIASQVLAEKTMKLLM